MEPRTETLACTHEGGCGRNPFCVTCLDRAGLLTLPARDISGWEFFVLGAAPCISSLFPPDAIGTVRASSGFLFFPLEGLV